MIPVAEVKYGHVHQIDIALVALEVIALVEHLRGDDVIPR